MNLKNIHFFRSFLSIKKYKFSDFVNKNTINDLFLANKKLTDEGYQLLKNMFKVEKKIHMFQISTLTKIFFIVTRFQIMFYGIGTSVYTIYNFSQKFSHYYDKKTEQARIIRIKLIVFLILALSSAAIGGWVSFKMGRRIVKSIYYIPNEKKFEVNFYSLFCRTKTVNVDFGNLKKINKKRRFDSSAEIQILNNPKFNIISTKGTGLFVNRPFFERFIDDEEEKNN